MCLNQSQKAKAKTRKTFAAWPWEKANTGLFGLPASWNEPGNGEQRNCLLFNSYSAQGKKVIVRYGVKWEVHGREAPPTAAHTESQSRPVVRLPYLQLWISDQQSLFSPRHFLLRSVRAIFKQTAQSNAAGRVRATLANKWRQMLRFTSLTACCWYTTPDLHNLQKGCARSLLFTQPANTTA